MSKKDFIDNTPPAIHSPAPRMFVASPEEAMTQQRDKYARKDESFLAKTTARAMGGNARKG